MFICSTCDNILNFINVLTYLLLTSNTSIIGQCYLLSVSENDYK